jgi:hypothetical protein
MQLSTTGTHIWRPASHISPNAYPGFDCAEHLLLAEGNDVAIVISVVKDILPDVEAFASSSLPQVHRIVSFTLPQGAGSTVVIDGTHACQLAQQVSQYCKEQRTHAERNGRLHLFISAPNGLVFFLGQQSRGFGPCLLYEYDFERNLPGDYHHTLAFPPLPLVNVQDEERIA